jgi:hypothetical protein
LSPAANGGHRGHGAGAERDASRGGDSAAAFRRLAERIGPLEAEQLREALEQAPVPEGRGDSRRRTARLLAAVVAHERAHLVGRHHLLVTLAGVPAEAFPRIPAFCHARVQVARLAELAADDAAAQRSPRLTVAGALLTLSAARPVLLSVPAQVVFVMACCH